MTQREFAIQVVHQLRDAGYNALWAGGCVRDALLNRPPGDFDVATSATPEQVRQVFGKRRTLAVGESFGVIVVLGPKGVEPIEVATFRSDGEYLDGRRPDSVIFSSPEEDAQRRDFTINGMFFDPLADEVIDYVGGRDDLKRRVIRAIGDPSARMEEDKLRLLRAVRFASTLNFSLEDKTARAVRAMAEQLSVVSAERIAQELRKMLSGTAARRAVEMCHETGLLLVIFAELDGVVKSDDIWPQVLSALDAVEGQFSVALAILCHALPRKAVESIARRLKLSNAEREESVWLVEHQHALDGAKKQSKATLKTLLVHKYFDSLATLVRALRSAKDEPLHDLEFIEQFRASYSQEELNPAPLVTGADLIELGLKPGKIFAELLGSVREAQLNETIRTREAALDMIRAAVDS